MKRTAIIMLLVVLATGCSYKSKVNFPEPDQLFVTTGDGDISKPYSPMGQLIYMETGFRFGLPILGLIPLHDIDPDKVLRKQIYNEIRAMGGDGLINMRIQWEPPKNGFLGLLASGGSIAVYGTVIKR